MAKRPTLGVAGVVTGIVVAVLAVTPAHAAAPAQPAAAGAAGTVQQAPPAPAGAPAQALAAVSPTTIPSVTTSLVTPNAAWSCSLGTFCALAWDPTKSKWKKFNFTICTDYALSNWNGTGYFLDNQTGGVTTYFLDDYYVVWEKIKPDNIKYVYNWDPIWYIENC
ncbi:hypothetical protein ACFQFC_11930 [Amorphoplanes digitatis]|uniref:Uncharacterized protein n=1 Tax=Actinoplanes digitatis TaxID=1868 RepID=A0A7W7I1Z1_9ACTN|nr:hypothetical protein [Actinoplanes digitatis]MBB4764910.1 hypothetical protein [Actinoplanes digitatis]GID94000.1 hypothetical protein Adi01nite_34120 [Actinoplanes digitatis]